MAREAATHRRVVFVTLVSFLVALASIVILPLIGTYNLSYERAWAGEFPDKEILFDLRVPRVILGVLAGGALSLSGVLFQALLREALATPYTMGVSSGASLGAVIAISFGWSQILGIGGVHVASLVGAFATLIIVLAAGTKRHMLSPFTLLLAGITVNSICMAAILFLHNIATLGQSLAITRWLMGGIEAAPLSTLGWVAAVVLPAALYSFLTARQWNLLAVGEEWAQIRGVAPSRYMLAGYFVSSLLTGAVTALTGPIGFVGLIVPHGLRLWLGPDHRLLVPASFFLGGAFLAGCDTIARMLLAPVEVPVGVITAMLGGPFFIWILRSRR